MRHLQNTVSQKVKDYSIKDCIRYQLPQSCLSLSVSSLSSSLISSPWLPAVTLMFYFWHLLALFIPLEGMKWVNLDMPPQKMMLRSLQSSTLYLTSKSSLFLAVSITISWLVQPETLWLRPSKSIQARMLYSQLLIKTKPWSMHGDTINMGNLDSVTIRIEIPLL